MIIPNHLRFCRPAWALLAALIINLSSCDDDNLGGWNEGESDIFEGKIKELVLFAETEGFEGDSFSLKILAPDKSIITRTGRHHRTEGMSHLSLTTGLKEGIYRLLYLECPIAGQQDEANAESKAPQTRQFGLGCLVSVDTKGAEVCSRYSPDAGFSGSGTKSDPYIVSSYDHLIKLAHKVNSDLSNSIFNESTCITQVVDIDMDDACFLVDHRYGWEPIGNDINLPFRGRYSGGGNKLTNVWSLRDKSPAIGLFGYIHGAAIDSLTIENSEFAGNFAVGSVAGAAVTAGARRDSNSITNCRTVGSKVYGSDGSLAIGGILGIADMHSRLMMYNCTNESTQVSGDYNVGGILGAASAYTLSSINNCTNSGRISSGFSGAGGIVGTTDTLYVTACSNHANISGGERFSASDNANAAVGTGGIAGGSGMIFATGCTNTAEIKGVEGVGGILGSTRVSGNGSSPFVFNNAAFRYCSNSGDISGTKAVGGICGESQFGSFGVINKGSISGDSYIGGIAGNTSVAVAHNAINTGDVSGKDYVAGIVAKSSFGSFALDDNFGEVKGSGTHTAGVVGLGGNNTIIHYCGNHGKVINKTGKHIGGIVGEVGDPRKWTGWNIAECIIGAAEIVMSIAGPCISLAEHALEESAHAVSLILKYSEFGFDMLLHATDAVIISNGFLEMAEGEEAENISFAIKTLTLDCASGINEEMALIRNSSDSYSVSGVSPTPLFTARAAFENDHIDWYSREGNDDIFNNHINEAREERMEAAEKVHKGSEILHQCIGAVCLVAGTVAAIGASVATGGVATAFIATGVITGIVGGVNAIEKSCMEFESNAVVISQCVNSGDIEGNDNSGVLVGSLQDNSIVRDCLNVGNGTGKEHAFVGHYGRWAGVETTINAGTGWCDSSPGESFKASAVSRKDGAGSGNEPYEIPMSGLMLIDRKALNNPEIIMNLDADWDFSSESSSRWTVTEASGAEIFYPVPAFSEMRPHVDSAKQSKFAL